MSTFRNVPGQLNTPIDNKLPRDQKLLLLANILGGVANSIDPDSAAGRIGAQVQAGSAAVAQNNILQREQQYMDAPQRPVNPGGQQFGGFGGLLPQNAQAGPSQLAGAGQPYQQQLAEGSFGGMGAIAPQVAQDTLQRQQQTGSGQQRTGGGSRQQQASPDPLEQLPRISAAEAMILGPQGVSTVNGFLRDFAQQVHTFRMERDQFKQEMELMRQRQEFELEQIRARADANVDIAARTGEIDATQARTGLIGAQTQGQVQQNQALTPELLRQDVQSQIGLRNAQSSQINSATSQEPPAEVTAAEQRFISNLYKEVGIDTNTQQILMAGGPEAMHAMAELPEETKRRLREGLIRGVANNRLSRDTARAHDPLFTLHKSGFSYVELRDPTIRQAFREEVPDNAIVELSDGTVVRKTSRGIEPVF